MVENIDISMEGDATMCVSCGCGQPNDDHGDQRNITQDDIDNAAQAAGITPNQVVQNIQTAMGYSGMPGNLNQTGSPDAFQNQSIGSAGHIGKTTPQSVDQTVQTTQAAFSSGTKPADVGQTEASG
jgi:hypothetical protein